ncbi:MAG: hypothetical protein KBA61_17785 [Spirochaetes bacterium]|jgi:hypothetical protein|nr:hypothetical protein [Spirochaetota bacterium]
MRNIKPIITLSEQKREKDTRSFWMSKTPGERIEAVETIREHYYSMLGYEEPPRIKKIIKLIRIG